MLAENDVENDIENGLANESSTDTPADTPTETTPVLPKFNYPEWYNEQQHGFYKRTIVRLQKLFKMNVASAKHYDRVNMYIFGPSISITVISSICSFLSTTDVLDESAKTGFGMTVGILTILSTALQSVAGTCQYKSRSEAFRIAADQYEQLLTRLRFECAMPNEENFISELEEKILEVQKKNSYFPPDNISSKYNINETNIV